MDLKIFSGYLTSNDITNDKMLKADRPRYKARKSLQVTSQIVECSIQAESQTSNQNQSLYYRRRQRYSDSWTLQEKKNKTINIRLDDKYYTP